MLRRSPSWFSPALVTLATLTACGGQSAAGSNGAAQPPIALSQGATGSNLDASPTQEIDITLQTIGPGEYGTPSISSDSVRFLEVTTPAALTPGGSTQEFRFEAENAGTAVVTIPHTVKSEPFDVTITVQ